PFLFRLGGRIESLVLRNIQHHNPTDARSLVDVGWAKSDTHHDTSMTHIRSLVIDGLHIFEADERAADASFINVVAPVDHLVVRNVEVVRPANGSRQGCLIETRAQARIGSLFLSNLCLHGIGCLLHHTANEISTVQLANVLASETGSALIKVGGAEIGTINATGVFGAELLEAPPGSKIGQVKASAA
ncbi:MAG TPA: hypothetical protein VHE61_11760, partial [Opitutaceae bacterium]|nr:hypothetical protein [Opitutaceae bacterium]